MDIQKLSDPTDDVYHSVDFQNLIESHLSKLRKSTNITTHAITAFEQMKYVGDYSGLLLNLNIPKKYHWIILRLNGYTSPLEYNGEPVIIFIPDLTEIERLKNTLLTKQ